MPNRRWVAFDNLYERFVPKTKHAVDGALEVLHSEVTQNSASHMRNNGAPSPVKLLKFNESSN